MKLRPYQLAAIEALRDKLRRGDKSLILVSPTGSGKTVIASEIVRSAKNKGNGVLFLVHRRELVMQAIARMEANGIEAGVIMAGVEPDITKMVQVASVQTLSRRKLPAGTVIIIDEAHHATAAGYKKIIDNYPGAVIIGLTATPFRLDGKGLGDLFSDFVKVATIEYLTGEGFLVPVRYWSQNNPNMKGIKKSCGDYNLSNFNTKLLGDPVSTYLKIGENKRAIAFCININHAQELADQFNAVGVAAASIDANTDNSIRLETLNRFNSGDIRVLTNCNILGEGYDCPAAEIVIMARPTASLGLYMQQIGRVLRPASGKTEARVFDHAGNVLRHGMIGEVDADLKSGISKKDKPKAPTVKVCKQCYAVVKTSAMVCECCGKEFRADRKPIKYKNGEIVEIKGQEIIVMHSKRMTPTDFLHDQIVKSVSKGYKKGRAWIIFKKYFKRNPTKIEMLNAGYFYD